MNRDENLPPYTKAYQLFSEGKKPKYVAITLRFSEAEATKFYLEYLRLGELPKLPFIYEKLRGPQGIGYLVELSKLALAEKMTAKQVLNLLKMVTKMFKLSFNRLLGKQRDNPEEAVFQDIEGYNDIKKIMMRCIVSSEPTNPLCRVTPVKDLEKANEEILRYDKEKYKEMILDGAQSILGYFGFDRTIYGDIKNTTPR